MMNRNNNNRNKMMLNQNNNNNTNNTNNTMNNNMNNNNNNRFFGNNQGGGGGGMNFNRNNNSMNNNYMNNSNNNNFSNNMNSNMNSNNFVRNRNNNFNYLHQHQHRPKPFVPHMIFDLSQAESYFQRVKSQPAQDDKSLNDAIIKRNQDLTPTANEQTHLLNLYTQVQSILDNLILSPGDFEACQIEEIRQVGSFKKGTMIISSKLVADLCVVLKTLPTREAVNQLANRVFSELKTTSSVSLAINERGFEILSTTKIDNDGSGGGDQVTDVACQCLITTLQHNIRKLEPNLHLDQKICYQNTMAIKHARWFEENASNLTVKVLIRILKDLKSRFDSLSGLNPWIIDLMAHYAVTNNPKKGEHLSLVIAFRRIFQLISSGFFLPGSVGIIDPLEMNQRVHTSMTLQEQDAVCNTFQTLLRILAYGGYRHILGFEGDSSLATSSSVWSSTIVVTPGVSVYEQNQMIDQTEQLNTNNQAAEPLDDQQQQFSESKIMPLMNLL